jgi:hypothetical protein
MPTRADIYVPTFTCAYEVVGTFFCALPSNKMKLSFIPPRPLRSSVSLRPLLQQQRGAAATVRRLRRAPRMRRARGGA